MSRESSGLFFVRIEEDSEAESETLFRYVARETRARLQHANPAHRRRGLYAELLVRYVIQCERGIPSAEQHFAREEKGKPYLEGAPAVHFNLSHSGNAVVLALANAPVGVDVERQRAGLQRVADRCFTPFEREVLRSGQDPDRCFFSVWTRKEAFGKQSGVGLCMQLREVEVLRGDCAKRIKTLETQGFLVSVATEDAELLSGLSVPRSKLHCYSAKSLAIRAQESLFPL